MAVLKVYKDVIEDVISAAREMFLEDGVDEQVLQELRQTWESKLMASKAVEAKTEVEKQNATKKSNGSSGGGAANASNNAEVANGNGLQKGQQTQQVGQAQKQVVGQVAPNNHVQTPQQVIETKMVPIQITLPAQPTTNTPQRVLTIQVPATALQDNLLHKVLTGQVITTTMNLPPSIASSVLQQHVNAAFSQLAPSMMSGIIGTATPNKTVIQNDGAHDDLPQFDIKVLSSLPPKPTASCSSSSSSTTTSHKFLPMGRKRLRLSDLIKQFDGPLDTSDDDDDASDDDDISDNDDDEKDDDEQEMDDGGPEEEPLNSEDDVTDEDPVDIFDTDNVVVCQYDKITRSRNKWKFHLKDGIMNLKGEDYVFQKANGDAEW